MTTKTYSNRDTATSFLRKMGIDRTHYAELIIKSRAEGQDIFIVDVTKAEQLLTGKPSVAVPAVPKKKPAPKAKAPEPAPAPTEVPTPHAGRKARPSHPDGTRRGKHERGRTVSSVARELILQGLDNNAVYAKLAQEFPDKIDANKKYYPAWYRSELRGKGFKV